MMPLAVDAHMHAVMHQTVGMHALADAGLVEQPHRALLDHAGSDAAQHVVGGLPFQDNVVDAVPVEQLAEQ